MKQLKKKGKEIAMQTKEILLGCHVSIAGGIHKAPANAQKYGANCFAMFTGNQRTWTQKALGEDEAASFVAACKERNFTKEQILPHGSYLINLGSPDAEKLEKSRQLFYQEVKRCHQLKLKYYNFHPGSTLSEITEDECCDRVAESINLCHEKIPEITIVIENTAGQGSNIGNKFEHLKRIIEKVSDKTRVGVCVDTCHAFAAGYDLREREAFIKTFEKFDEVVGFQYLKGIHLNDSKGPLGCKKDRHEGIGKGHLGLKSFHFLVNDKRFYGVPIILETPGDQFDKEITLLKSLIGKSDEEVDTLQKTLKPAKKTTSKAKEEVEEEEEEEADEEEEPPKKKKAPAKKSKEEVSASSSTESVASRTRKRTKSQQQKEEAESINEEPTEKEETSSKEKTPQKLVLKKRRTTTTTTSSE